jgi:hypothetical protein
MSIEPVLNELSLEQPAPDINEARRRMSRFIQTLIVATSRYRLKRTLRVKNELLNYQDLAPEYPLVRWRNDREVSREEREFFRILETKQPYLVEHADKQDAAIMMECYWMNRRAIGFQVALLLDSLAISLPSDPAWNASRIEVLVREIDSDGEWIPDRNEQVYHIARRAHLQELADWITQRLQEEADQALQMVQTGQDLWEQRRELYPSLEFCAAVEEQLLSSAVQVDHLKAIRLRLRYLEEYSRRWRTTGGSFDKEQLAGHASPESSSTLQHPDYGPKRRFLCPDGKQRVFSWHLRVTLSWRLHFYPDEERQTIIVGYIGPHLPIVTQST